VKFNIPIDIYNHINTGIIVKKKKLYDNIIIIELNVLFCFVLLYFVIVVVIYCNYNNNSL